MQRNGSDRNINGTASKRSTRTQPRTVATIYDGKLKDFKGLVEDLLSAARE